MSKAVQAFETSVKRLEMFCKELKNVSVKVNTSKYPIVIVITCIPQQVMFDAEEATEFDTITVSVGLTTTVKVSSKLKINAKDLNKIMKLSEKAGIAYLHAFFEQSIMSFQFQEAKPCDSDKNDEEE